MSAADVARILARRRVLAGDVLRHGKENPAQRRVWEAELSEIDTRLRVLGIDVRDPIEARDESEAA